MQQVDNFFTHEHLEAVINNPPIMDLSRNSIVYLYMWVKEQEFG